MAAYFVSQSGSNTAPYDTWAKAATSLATALAAATGTTDVVVLDAGNPPTVDKEVTVDTTYTFAASSVLLVCSTNSGTATITPTTMGTSQWIGNSTTNRTITFASAVARRNTIYGLTIRTAGATTDSIVCNNTSGSYIHYINSYLWSGNTVSTARITLGPLTAGAQNAVRFDNCVFRFANTGQGIGVSAGAAEFYNCTLSSAGSIPTTLFLSISTAGGNRLDCEGCDWSALGSGTIFGEFSGGVLRATMTRCKLGANFVALAAQLELLAGATLFLSDCDSGDVHGLFGYYNGLGSVVTDSTITYTGSPVGRSWKIVTNANTNGINPFYTPYVDWYQTGTSSITPRFEILRDGSTTAYTNAEVWAEWQAKVTTGSVISTAYNDRQSWAAFASGTAGASQDAGAGLSAWTGESGTAWSGKIDTGAAITPAEVGEIRGRIAVAASSTTVYVDPYIRT